MNEPFADKLNRLFQTITRADGAEYSPEEIQVATDKAITSSYIYRLRAGKSANPTIDKVQALAEFFGIDPGYFFADPGTNPATDPDQLAASVALRTRNIDLKTIEELLMIVQTLREAEAAEADADGEGGST